MQFSLKQEPTKGGALVPPVGIPLPLGRGRKSTYCLSQEEINMSKTFRTDPYRIQHERGGKEYHDHRDGVCTIDMVQETPWYTHKHDTECVQEVTEYTCVHDGDRAALQFRLEQKINTLKHLRWGKEMLRENGFPTSQDAHSDFEPIAQLVTAMSEKNYIPFCIEHKTHTMTREEALRVVPSLIVNHYDSKPTPSSWKKAHPAPYFLETEKYVCNPTTKRCYVENPKASYMPLRAPSCSCCKPDGPRKAERAVREVDLNDLAREYNTYGELLD